MAIYDPFKTKHVTEREIKLVTKVDKWDHHHLLKHLNVYKTAQQCAWPAPRGAGFSLGLGTLLRRRLMVSWGISSQTWIRTSVSGGGGGIGGGSSGYDNVSGALDWIPVRETASSVKSIVVFTGNKMKHASVETSTGAACWRSLYQGWTDSQITAPLLICWWSSGVLAQSSTLYWRHSSSVLEEQMTCMLFSVNKLEIL